MKKLILILISVVAAQIICAQNFISDPSGFNEMNGEEILQKIQSLKLGTHTLSGKRYFAPDNQTWFQTFGKDKSGLIGSDTLFTWSDRTGVLLIAVKTLNQKLFDQQNNLAQQGLMISQIQSQEVEFSQYRQKVEQMTEKISQLQGEVYDLKQKLEKLEQQINELKQ